MLFSFLTDTSYWPISIVDSYLLFFNQDKCSNFRVRSSAREEHLEISSRNGLKTEIARQLKSGHWLFGENHTLGANIPTKRIELENLNEEFKYLSNRSVKKRYEWKKTLSVLKKHAVNKIGVILLSTDLVNTLSDKILLYGDRIRGYTTYNLRYLIKDWLLKKLQRLSNSILNLKEQTFVFRISMAVRLQNTSHYFANEKAFRNNDIWIY